MSYWFLSIVVDSYHCNAFYANIIFALALAVKIDHVVIPSMSFVLLCDLEFLFLFLFPVEYLLHHSPHRCPHHLPVVLFWQFVHLLLTPKREMRRRCLAEKTMQSNLRQMAEDTMTRPCLAEKTMQSNLRQMAENTMTMTMTMTMTRGGSLR